MANVDLPLPLFWFPFGAGLPLATLELMISPATDSFEYLLDDNEKNPLAKGARTA
jgi:hypothetical protein